MGINPVQLPVRETPLDKVAKGLQIAQSLFSIPVNYEQFQKFREENKAASDQREGKYTVAEAAKAGLEFHPNQPPPQNPYDGENQPAQADDGSLLTPPARPTPLQPPTAEPTRFLKLPKYPGQIYGQGGQLIPGSFTSHEQEKEQYAQEAGLRDKLAQEAPVQIVKQGVQNYSNAKDAFSVGNKEGDVLALMNVAKLFNPGVTRAVDGQSLENVQGVPQQLIKRFNSLIGSNDIALTPTERSHYSAMADVGMRNQITNAKSTQDRYAGLAQQSGFLPQNVGIEDYSRIVPDRTAKGGTGSRPSTASPALDPVQRATLIKRLQEKGVNVE